jgi:hypothetical protein
LEILLCDRQGAPGVLLISLPSSAIIIDTHAALCFCQPEERPQAILDGFTNFSAALVAESLMNGWRLDQNKKHNYLAIQIFWNICISRLLFSLRNVGIEEHSEVNGRTCATKLSDINKK